MTTWWGAGVEKTRKLLYEILALIVKSAGAADFFGVFRTDFVLEVRSRQLQVGIGQCTW